MNIRKMNIRSNELWAFEGRDPSDWDFGRISDLSDKKKNEKNSDIYTNIHDLKPGVKVDAQDYRGKWC